MRLLSWNIKQGGGKRINSQINALLALKPDVIALQEIFTNTVSVYTEKLNSKFKFIENSFNLAPDKSVLTGPRKYGLLIASRWPIEIISSDEFDVPWPERILSVVINHPTIKLAIYNTHIPPGASNGWIKIEMLEGIFKKFSKAINFPQILCGDFNAPQLETSDGRIITWSQIINKNGNPEIWNEWKGGAGERWDLAERNIFQHLVNYDLPDTFRLLNGYNVEEYSWFWKGKGKLIGRRFDHVFASKKLKPTKCTYLHNFRDQGLSDHAPIEVLFDI